MINDAPISQKESREEGNMHSQSTTPVPEIARAQPPKLHVGKEIADTTWRMTVPVVIFAITGIYADIKFDFKPWATFVGVIIGFYFAAILIKKQLQRSKDA
jgi:hypothetical protein